MAGLCGFVDGGQQGWGGGGLLCWEEVGRWRAALCPTSDKSENPCNEFLGKDRDHP